MPHFDLDLAVTNQGTLAPGARFYFTLTVGGAAEPITDYAGNTLPFLQSSPINATTPPFMHATATSGYITDGKSVTRYVFAMEARDASAAVKAAQDAAASAAQVAANSVSAQGQSLEYIWPYNASVSAYPTLPSQVLPGVVRVKAVGPRQPLASEVPTTGPWAPLRFAYSYEPS